MYIFAKFYWNLPIISMLKNRFFEKKNIQNFCTLKKNMSFWENFEGSSFLEWKFWKTSHGHPSKSDGPSWK